MPTTYLNDAEFGAGRMLIEEILAKVDTGAAARAAESLGSKEAFDVLVVGGGPAGASAAIYAARKGIRTGVLAERSGALFGAHPRTDQSGRRVDARFPLHLACRTRTGKFRL